MSGAKGSTRKVAYDFPGFFETKALVDDGLVGFRLDGMKRPVALDLKMAQTISLALLAAVAELITDRN